MSWKWCNHIISLLMVPSCILWWNLAFCRFLSFHVALELRHVQFPRHCQINKYYTYEMDNFTSVGPLLSKKHLKSLTHFCTNKNGFDETWENQSAPFRDLSTSGLDSSLSCVASSWKWPCVSSLPYNGLTLIKSWIIHSYQIVHSRHLGCSLSSPLSCDHSYQATAAVKTPHACSWVVAITAGQVRLISPLHSVSWSRCSGAIY